MAQKSLLKDKPRKLIQKYYQALEAEGIPIEQIILFGSHAAGKADQDSDLDLCVVSREFGKDPFREMVRLAKIATKIESLIEPHPYHPSDLQEKYDPLAQEIRTHGIRII